MFSFKFIPGLSRLNLWLLHSWLSLTIFKQYSDTYGFQQWLTPFTQVSIRHKPAHHCSVKHRFCILRTLQSRATIREVSQSVWCGRRWLWNFSTCMTLFPMSTHQSYAWSLQLQRAGVHWEEIVGFCWEGCGQGEISRGMYYASSWIHVQVSSVPKQHWRLECPGNHWSLPSSSHSSVH